MEITQTAILKAIKMLKTSRCGGPDKLLNDFFINVSDSLWPYLHIFLLIEIYLGINL